MSTTGTRRSRLAGAMGAKAAIPPTVDEEATEAATTRDAVETVDQGETGGAVLQFGSHTPASDTAPAASDVAVVDEPQPTAAPEPTPTAEPASAPKQRTRTRPTATPAADMTHLRAVMEGGPDQRRYVEDNLTRRTGKGTFIRLPIHLQDALAQYCDRDNAPMADFVAAVLDAYFRDLGLLPPLGEGHRPDEKFIARLREQTRTYSY